MKIYRKIISIIITFSVLLVSVSTVASASEENRLLIPNARWIHMAYNSNNKPSITATFNITGLDGQWDNPAIYFAAFSNLMNGLDQRVILTYLVSNPQSADIELKTPDTWIYPSELYGFTTLFNNYGMLYDGGMTNMGVTVQQFGTKINKGYVLLNPFSTYPSIRDMRKTLAHEIMHCFNFAHPPYNNMQTIMRNGFNLDWDNYEIPTAYDLRLFEITYNQIYS